MKKLDKSYFGKDGKMLEKGIQRQICDYLQSLNAFFWRSNNIPVFGKSGGGGMRYRAQPKFTPKGLPDIFLLTSGNITGIEVKRPGQKLSEEQSKFSINFIRNGGYYLKVDSLDSFKKYFFHENEKNG